MSQYRFLHRKHINPAKWDNCVKASTDLPYPLYWYLDAVCFKHWSALVLRDYEAVFPIIWKSTIGIKYVYQPFFCQQLGMFSPEPHPQFENICLRFLQRKFLFSELNLHHHSAAEDSSLLKARQNFILHLKDSYETISDGYSKNTQRNLAKSKVHFLRAEQFNDVKQFVKLYEENVGFQIRGYAEKHNQILEQIVTTALSTGNGELTAAYTGSGNNIVAVCFMLFSGKRIINLAPVSLKHSRESGGMTFLIDYYIQKFSCSDRILDFEGSSIESIAHFYKGFGAKLQPFWQYNHNLWHVLKQPFIFTPNHYK